MIKKLGVFIMLALVSINTGCSPAKDEPIREKVLREGEPAVVLNSEILSPGDWAIRAITVQAGTDRFLIFQEIDEHPLPVIGEKYFLAERNMIVRGSKIKLGKKQE